MLDPFCRAHGLSNLYVADSSFMPTSNGVNPSLTIAANALRVADRIAATLSALEPAHGDRRVAMTPPERVPGALLLYVPVPVHGAPDAPLFEPQACNGLRLWAENFPRVIVLLPPHGGPVAPPA